MTEPDVFWGLEREAFGPPKVLLTFVVPGDPASKARPRFSGKGSKTRTYTPEATKAAEELVAWKAREAGWRRPPDPESGFGLLCVFFTATYQRRDVDNMLKLVSDGLNKIVYADDSQITEVSARVMRADDNPRSHVMVYETTPQTVPTTRCAGPGCEKWVKIYPSVVYRTCSKECERRFRESVPWVCRACGKAELRSASRAKIVYCNETCRRADPSPRVRATRS